MIVAAACIGFGSWQLWQWRDWDARFAQWQIDIPVRVRLATDLKGTYAADFTQTCAIAHAQQITLEPVNADDQPKVLAAAKNLQISGTVESRSEAAGACGLQDWERQETESGVVVARIAPPPMDGACRLRVSISGQPATDIGPVDLVMRNELCGLEAMPGLLHAGLGILSLTAGALIAAITAAAWAASRSVPGARPLAHP